MSFFDMNLRNMIFESYAQAPPWWMSLSYVRYLFFAQQKEIRG